MPQILIVDDNQDLLNTYTVLLPALGFDVLTASDGFKGLEMVAEYATSIACAVIDVRMPELNGYQLVQAIRGDPATEHLPLIMVTAMTQTAYRQHGAFVGVDFYLTKPVDPENLIAIIQTATHLAPIQRDARLRTLSEEGN